MDHVVERELTVAEDAEEVWRSLAEPGWLGEDASIELREAGDVEAGDKTGFVEEADAPRRLVFWWSDPGEEATRVEIELDETAEGTHIRVTESRPLAILARHGRVKFEQPLFFVRFQLVGKCELVRPARAVQQRDALGRVRAQRVIQHRAKRRDPRSARDEEQSAMRQRWRKSERANRPFDVDPFAGARNPLQLGEHEAGQCVVVRRFFEWQSEIGL